MKTAALKFAIFFVTVMIFAGCAGHAPRHPNVVIRGGSNTVAPGQTITLTAVVTNDKSGAGVVWAVVGSGTFTSTTTSLTYTAPANVPENPVVMVTATTIATPTATETISFTLVGTGASDLMFLNGSYAFEASGFASNGDALTLAGSFVSDGNGHIVSGEIDDNFAFTFTNTTQVAGTYTLDNNLRGVITLNSGFNGFSDNATFAFTIDSATNTGSIVSADGEMPAVSGLLAAQNPVVLSATPSGSFIFRGTSDGGAIRAGAVGRFTIGAGGTISNGLIDSADIVQGNDSVDDALTGTFSAADPAGRGTVSFTANSGIANGSYAYYAVSPTEIFLVQGDSSAGSQFVDVARGQSTLSAGSVNGTGVFGLVGADNGAVAGAAQIASAAIGQMVITGGNTASIVCDVNDATVTTQCSTNSTTPTPIPGTVTFDPTTGRGTLSITSGFNNGFVDSATFYIEANGAGVMMDTTEPNAGGSLPEALVGDWIPQTSTADIAGQVQGVGLTGDNNAFAIAGVFNITNDGGITGLFDGSAPQFPPVLDSGITGTAGNTDPTGRTDLQVSGEIFGGQNQPAASFSASPGQYFVIVEADTVETDLGIFTPQTLPAAQAAVKATSKAKTNLTGAAAKLRSRHLDPAVAAKHQRRNAVKGHQETITPRQHE